MENINDYPVKFTHKECGKIAFLGKHLMTPNHNAMNAEDFINPDGSKPEAHTAITCFSCKEPINLPPREHLFQSE